MHRDPDSYQEKDEISCSDYRFVYMGAKGIASYKIVALFFFLNVQPHQNFYMVLHQVLGLHFMRTFSGHTAGQQMFVERNNGFFCLLLSLILYSTGMDIVLFFALYR